MFKFLVTIALLIAILEARSQSCAVKSFRWEDPRDVKDMPMPIVDLSGKKCAVIKVETRQKGFEFDFGITGNAVATMQKDSAQWLWVPEGAKEVTVSNKKLNLLCKYPLGTELEEGVVYVIVLYGDNLKNSIKGAVETKWVNLKSYPPKGANIFIDDFPAGKTPFYGSLTMGSHKVRMEKNKVVMEKSLFITPLEEVKFELTFDAEIKALQKQNEGALIEYEEYTEYPGGYEAMLKFLYDNMKYPTLAQEKKIEGTVFVQFVISITGKISNVRILRGIGGGCDEEAVRVVKMMPKWKQDRWDGAVKPVMFQIPVKFQLPEKK